MGYSVNFINKGDIIIIDGVRFCAKYDFNLVEGHKNLLLKRIGDEPKVHIAQIKKEGKINYEYTDELVGQ